jgi:hypothetical protein
MLLGYFICTSRVESFKSRARKYESHAKSFSLVETTLAGNRRSNAVSPKKFFFVFVLQTGALSVFLHLSIVPVLIL